MTSGKPSRLRSPTIGCVRLKASGSKDKPVRLTVMTCLEEGSERKREGKGETVGRE